MKKLLFPLLLLASSLGYGAVVTERLTVTKSTITLNGTTYYWQAGTGVNGQALKTDGAAQPTLTFGSVSSSGGGYAVEPATVTFLLDKGLRTSTGTITSLSPGVMHIISGSSNVVTAAVSLSSEVVNNFVKTIQSDAAFTSQKGLILNNTLTPNVIAEFQYDGSEFFTMDALLTGGLAPDELKLTFKYATNGNKLAEFLNSSSSGTMIRLYGKGGSANYVALKASDTIATSFVLTLPPAVGTVGQALTVGDTSGNLAFTTISGGGVSVYPATSTASFPFGFSASSAAFTSTNSYVYVSSFNVGGASITYEAANVQLQITTHVFVNGTFISSGNTSGYSTIDRGLIVNNGNYSTSGSSGNFTVNGNAGVKLLDIDPNTQITTVISSSMSFTNNLISTNTTNIGWSVKSGANTACNTTCTYSCVFGEDTSIVGTFVACSDATADVCVCAGPN